jgi:hypothetical protein
LACTLRRIQRRGLDELVGCRSDVCEVHILSKTGVGSFVLRH